MKSSLVETRLRGPFRSQFWLEFFGNSAHFPLINLLYEFLLEGVAYFRVPDFYALLFGSAVQSYWLARWQTTARPRRFWGNLIGPALYSVVETAAEGLEFFRSGNHLAYWIFSIGIGFLQELRWRLPARFTSVVIVIENVVRTAILFVMYALFEVHANPEQTTSLMRFFNDTSHQFIGLAVGFIGLIVGLSSWTAERYLALLKETSQQLYKYAQWLLGRELLEQSFINPSALNLTQRERVILFMDIRGFTHWSETHPPAYVAELLNKYYQVSETVLSQHRVFKFKLSADEVMAVFPTAESAVRAALELQTQISALLANEQLGAGIGIHSGLVVEGMLGSTGVGFYDVIGDTVNTAKRIESAALSGEVLISGAVREKAGGIAETGASRELVVKGKSAPLIVYPLLGLRAN